MEGGRTNPTEEGSYTTHGTKGTEERKGGKSFLLFFFFFLTLSSGKWTGDVLVGVRGAEEEEEEGRAELVTADTEGAKVGGKGAKNVGRNTVSFTSIRLPFPFSQKKTWGIESRIITKFLASSPTPLSLPMPG